MTEPFRKPDEPTPPVKKPEQVAQHLDRVIGELKGILAGIGQDTDAPSQHVQEEVGLFGMAPESPPGPSSDFLPDRVPMPVSGEPSDSEFWRGNVLGWPVEPSASEGSPSVESPKHPISEEMPGEAKPAVPDALMAPDMEPGALEAEPGPENPASVAEGKTLPPSSAPGGASPWADVMLGPVDDVRQMERFEGDPFRSPGERPVVEERGHFSNPDVAPMSFEGGEERSLLRNNRMELTGIEDSRPGRSSGSQTPRLQDQEDIFPDDLVLPPLPRSPLDQQRDAEGVPGVSLSPANEPVAHVPELPRPDLDAPAHQAPAQPMREPAPPADADMTHEAVQAPGPIELPEPAVPPVETDVTQHAVRAPGPIGMPEPATPLVAPDAEHKTVDADWSMGMPEAAAPSGAADDRTQPNAPEPHPSPSETFGSHEDAGALPDSPTDGAAEQDVVQEPAPVPLESAFPGEEGMPSAPVPGDLSPPPSPAALEGSVPDETEKGTASGFVPIPGSLDVSEEDLNALREAQDHVPDMVQLACIYPEGREQDGELFMKTLKEKAGRMSRPLVVEPVFLHPWKENDVDVAAWKKSSLLAGADYVIVLGSRADRPRLGTISGSEGETLGCRLVFLEQLAMPVLYADLLVEMAGRRHGKD